MRAGALGQRGESGSEGLIDRDDARRDLRLAIDELKLSPVFRL